MKYTVTVLIVGNAEAVVTYEGDDNAKAVTALSRAWTIANRRRNEHPSLNATVATLYDGNNVIAQVQV